MKGNQEHPPSPGIPSPATPWAQADILSGPGCGISCAAAVVLLGDDANDTL